MVKYNQKTGRIVSDTELIKEYELAIERIRFYSQKNAKSFLDVKTQSQLNQWIKDCTKVENTSLGTKAYRDSDKVRGWLEENKKEESRKDGIVISRIPGINNFSRSKKQAKKNKTVWVKNKKFAWNYEINRRTSAKPYYELRKKSKK